MGQHDSLREYRRKRDPRQRRMARRTEDHPLDYADFEMAGEAADARRNPIGASPSPCAPGGPLTT